VSTYMDLTLAISIDRSASRNWHDVATRFSIGTEKRFMCTEIKSDWASGEAADFYIKLLCSESQFQNADSNLTLLNLLTDASSLR
jgi:hypothetical protein